MKKLMCIFFAFAALLMLTVPTFAAAVENSVPARYDLLDPDGPEPAAVSYAPIPDRGEPPADGQNLYTGPVVLNDSSASPTPQQPEADPAEPVYHGEDVPVDESTYREEPSTPYTPPERLPGQGEITDILQYWEDNGYPDNASYAFEAGGEMMDDGTIYSYWEIGLVDASEAQKQEILELVHPTCLVEFRNCLFTHAQKQAAYDTITELAVTDENILEVIFIRNGDTVWVSVPEELTKEYAQYLIRELGLGAVVSVTDQHSISYFQGGVENPVMTPGMGLDTAGVSSPAGAPTPAPDITIPQSTVITGGESGLLPAAPEAARTSPVLWVCLALAITAACVLTTLALRRRPAAAAVTPQGTVHTGHAPLTRRETEQAVREAEASPDSGLYHTILEHLEESEK